VSEATEAPRLIPAEQAAKLLARHPITLRRDLREGRIPGVRIGGRWFVSSAVIDLITAPPAHLVTPTT
jgi:hypothetical protein